MTMLSSGAWSVLTFAALSAFATLIASMAIVTGLTCRALLS